MTNMSDNNTEQNKMIEKNHQYWRTLSQWGNDPEFQKLAETEFQSSPLREDQLSEGDQDGGWARREFLKLMGASLAMASTACIRRPIQKIVPYNKAVEEITFGIPNYYTSAFYDGSEALGLLVKTREGRPLKIEGNEKHPLGMGATSARAQAAILSLYDPDRLQAPQKVTAGKLAEAKWEEADAAVVEQLKKGGVVVLTGNAPSPSKKALISEFVAGVKGRHVMWEPLANDDVREGQKASYGDDVLPFFRFDKARMIVSVDADFLGTWVAPTTFSKQFAAGRKDIPNMSKLVVFDSGFSLTGANADIRIKIKPSQQLTVVMGLAHEIVVKKGMSKFAANASVKATLSQFADAATKIGVQPELMTKMAEDLWKNKGQSLVVAGGLASQTAQSKELQVAVNFLNSALENDGHTIDSKGGFLSQASSKAMTDLIESMKKGTVQTLILNGVNPAYALPKSAGFAEALKNVGMVISTSEMADETAVLSNYILPDNNVHESWGDLEAIEGVYSIQQPTIRPMYDTRSFELSLMTWAKSAKTAGKRTTASESYYDFVRTTWKDEVHPKFGKGTDFETFWDHALQAGFMDAGKGGKSSARNFKVEALSSIKPVEGKGTELVLYPTVALGDGRFANISWLQELPDPVSKICWDNFASISIGTSEKMKLNDGDIVELRVGKETLKLPVHVQPGLHDEVVAVAIGYGRTNAGKVGTGVGVNAYNLIQSTASGMVASGLETTMTKAGEKMKLASVAGQDAMSDRQEANDQVQQRKIIVEATLAEYLKDKSANNHRHHVFSIWSGHQYNGHKWGMSVDLNTCTGCSACMVACQSENNIPVVGKQYVLQGRIMHWIRLDRYYVGNPKDAEVVFQPVMCQQCDNAPCETVCPVLATAHSNEGLNDMSYNRCVGTRYCSNNCPYKVRRFNWFNYTGKVEKPLNLQYNPDVTVRPRGVMEKCTFCVHRIKAGKNTARLQQREVKDGDIKTACEQVCPTNALVFGDLNDANSRVAKIFKEEQRAYGLIEEFNAAPSVRYLTKIRNNDKEKRNSDSHSKGGHA